MNPIKHYFSSAWIPSCLSLIFLLIAGFFDFLGSYRFVAWSDAFATAFAISLLGILLAALWNFLTKHWLRGFLNLLGLPTAFVAVFLVSLLAMLGPSEDGFADNLTIPPDLEISEPLEQNLTPSINSPDPFQVALLAALASEGADDTNVTAITASLGKLAREYPQILQRYLTSHPAWRIYKDGGKRYATRRWKVGDHWEWDFGGYFSSHRLNSKGLKIPEDFEFRLTLGLDGKPWFENASTSRLKPGQTLAVVTSKENDKASQTVIESDPIAVEIFERRQGNERRLTKAALAELEKELAPLLANPTWESALSLLPNDTITHGSPSIELHKGLQGGIYEVSIRDNPGEPGTIFLKAFEVTQGTPLSVRRLQHDSQESIGWSNNPTELFLANSVVLIKEGDRGKPYAARFEVWFTPDAGTPPRKLQDKTFKIEGWMH